MRPVLAGDRGIWSCPVFPGQDQLEEISNNRSSQKDNSVDALNDARLAAWYELSDTHNVRIHALLPLHILPERVMRRCI